MFPRRVLRCYANLEQRSIRLLRQAAVSPPPTALDEEFLPDKFAEPILRREVGKLGLKPLEKPPSQPTVKRRRLAEESSTLGWVIQKIGRLVNSDRRGVVRDISVLDLLTCVCPDMKITSCANEAPAEMRSQPWMRTHNARQSIYSLAFLVVLTTH